MTDSMALRAWLAEKGIKLKAVALKMGITPYSLSKKINNETEFKASEITIFTSEYGMSAEIRDQIFFAAV